MDMQGAHAKVLILQRVLGAAHFLLLTFISSRRETGRKSSLPTGAMLSFKKTQEWKKRRTEDVLASSVHEEFKVKGF